MVFHAGGLNRPIVPWRRDLVDIYRFNVEAPAGTTTLPVSFDILTATRDDDSAGYQLDYHPGEGTRTSNETHAPTC